MFVPKTLLGDDQTGFSEEAENIITEAEDLSAGEEAAKSEKAEGKDDIPAGFDISGEES